jgi:hypothetical protein
MQIYTHIYTHADIYTQIHTHIHIYTHIYAHIHTHISTNNTAIRLVRTYVGASWRFCKRPPTDVEITPQSQTYPSDSTRLPPRAVAATSMRVAAAAGVGAGEVGLEDGSEPRRIWDLDLCRARLSASSTWSCSWSMLRDGSGRTDSAAEQPTTSSSAEQREERMDDMSIFASFSSDPPRSVFASSEFLFEQFSNDPWDVQQESRRAAVRPPPSRARASSSRL